MTASLLLGFQKAAAGFRRPFVINSIFVTLRTEQCQATPSACQQVAVWLCMCQVPGIKWDSEIHVLWKFPSPAFSDLSEPKSNDFSIPENINVVTAILRNFQFVLTELWEESHQDSDPEPSDVWSNPTQSVDTVLAGYSLRSTPPGPDP